MQRLLADAKELTGIDYNIDNLGDVYDAIHVIQDDLGLTGVAAEEASQTFSGSFDAMKAAAKNFLGSLAIGENVGQALSTLLSTVNTFFFNNFLPMLGTIIRSLPGAVAVFLKEGIPMLLTSVQNLITTLANYVSSLADGVTSSVCKDFTQESSENHCGGQKNCLRGRVGSRSGDLGKGHSGCKWNQRAIYGSAFGFKRSSGVNGAEHQR